MSFRHSVRLPAPLLAMTYVTLAVGGCVYLNSLYNARTLFGEGERARLDGRDSVAHALYDSVVAKATRSYEREPDGTWADDALFLLGRAQLRRGELDAARRAFRETRRRTDDPRLSAGATLYLGAVATLEGDREEGVLLLNDGIREMEDGELRAEGHLWRARANLAAGWVDSGWWDLDRAAEADPRLTATADLERVVWGIARDDTARARQGVSRLLGDAPSHTRADTVANLVGAARSRWGPRPAAALLGSAEASPWPPDARHRILLLRAELRLQAGDTAAARADARAVADGFGRSAVLARLFLADLTLVGVETVPELARVRPVLLPVSDAPPVLEVLETVRTVELLYERGQRSGEELALFAAAEVARDALGAPRLARTLFLRYAERAEPHPWAGKAVLAALALSDPGEEARAVRSRLDFMSANPYVRASRTGRFSSVGFARLEDTLREGLRDVLAKVSEEVVERDVLLRVPADTLR